MPNVTHLLAALLSTVQKATVAFNQGTNQGINQQARAAL
jgi:hypothetical protein